MKFLLALVVAMVSFLSFRGIASLDHNVWLPGDPADFPVQRRLMERGYLNYCFDQTALVYPNFRAQAAQVVQAAAKKHGIWAYEVSLSSGLCDVYNTMPPDNQFTCGPGAAACIKYWLSQVLIQYRAALSYTDWRTAQAHEGVGNSGHLLWQHERYFDQVSPFQCDFFATYTTMSCGTAVWQVTDWDRDAIWNAFVPDAPCPRTFSTLNGWTTLAWGNVRCDNGLGHLHGIPANTNATRVSFGYMAPGSDTIVWVGEQCGPAYNYCYSSYHDYSRGFDAYWTQPGACFYIRAENAATWAVPQISAPNYWTWVGCV